MLFGENIKWGIQKIGNSVKEKGRKEERKMEKLKLNGKIEVQELNEREMDKKGKEDALGVNIGVSREREDYYFGGREYVFWTNIYVDPLGNR